MSYINYAELGSKIFENITQRTAITSVTYTKKALQKIGTSNKEIGALIGDVFINSKNPQVTINVRDSKKRTLGKVIMSDLDGILHEHDLVFPSKTNVTTFLPQIKDVKVKRVFKNQEINKLIKKDAAFREFVGDCLKNAKNPSIEITTRGDMTEGIALIVIKDEDVVIKQGAFSVTKNKKGDTVTKYHFTEPFKLISGYVEKSKQRRAITPYLSKDQKEKFEIISDFHLSSRTSDIMRAYFGINRKSMTIKELCDLYKYLPTRIRYYINEGVEGMKNISLVSPDLNTDIRKLKPSKYLTESEKQEFLSARSLLLSDFRPSVEQGILNLERLIDTAKLRSQKALYDASIVIKQ